MTRDEAIARILSRWLNGADDFNAHSLMMMAICLGAPMRKTDVLGVVRRYCDRETENRRYARKARS